MATPCLCAHLLGTGNNRAGLTIGYGTIGLSGRNLGPTPKLKRDEPGIFPTFVAITPLGLLNRVIGQVQRHTELSLHGRSTLFES